MDGAVHSISHFFEQRLLVDDLKSSVDFEGRMSTGSGLFALLSDDFEQIFGQIVSIREKARRTFSSTLPPVLESFRRAFSPGPTDCPWVSEDAEKYKPEDSIFMKIIRKEIHADIVYENDKFVILLCKGRFKICGLKDTEDSGSRGGGGRTPYFKGRIIKWGQKSKQQKPQGY